MNTQDKLINVKDLNLTTSAVMTKMYDIQDNSESAITKINYTLDDLDSEVNDLYERVGNLPSPMVFKGSLGTGGTITSLPTASTDNEGYTYKVITAGTYASQAAKVGDAFISDGSNWVLIPSGDEPSGTVTSVTLKANSPISIDSTAAITTSGTRTISHATSGVTAGTYRSVTVNATGHVTAGTNPTTLSGYGITDAKIANGVITLGSNTITPLTASSTLDASKVSGTLPTSTYTNTTYNDATTSTHGLMSTTDKAKMTYTNIAYGTCSTAAATAAKEITVSGNTNWDLQAGSIIVVKFSATNTAQNPTFNVNSKGAKSVWYNTSLITTGNLGYAGTVNRPMIYMYDGTQFIFLGWSLDANDNTYDRTRYNQSIKAGTTAIVAANIIVANSSGLYTHLKLGNAFDITYPILYASGAISASGTGNNNYLCIPFTVTTTQSITLTQYKPVYIKGQLSGTTFTPISTTPLTQTIPTSADGYEYIYLGMAYSTTAIYLEPHHPIYAYTGGAFTKVGGKAITGLSVSGTTITYTREDNSTGTITTQDNNTTYSAGTGLSLSGTTFNHSNSVTAATVGTSSATSGSTLAVPYVTYDAQGHITATGTHIHTISGFSTTDTKNTAGSTDSSSKLFIIGATSQAANPQTYSQDTAYVGTDGHLYSNSVQVVNLSGSQALTNKTYNGYTLAAACAKGVVTSIDTSASLPTSNAVKTFVEGKGYTTNTGTITGITMNGASKGTSGVVDLGTVATTDTKNTAGSTDTSSKIFLIGATSQATNPQTYSNNEIYATSGVLTTKSVQVGGTAATIQYNSTDKCIEFIFA